MANSDDEIEYLDEDADIVQQCVQTVHNVSLPVSDMDYEFEEMPSLLVKREPMQRKKRKIAEDDSDYDPREDVSTPTSSKSNKSKKKKPASSKKPVKVARISNSTPKQSSAKIAPKKPVPEVDPMMRRKKTKIIIPDYADPLCLPVRAVKNDDADVEKLENWNNACLEHLRNCDSVLRPENGRTVGSTRSVVLKNVVNTKKNKLETSIWIKTCVENENGVKKSQIFQSILPKYREKETLDLQPLGTAKKPKKYHHVDEAILTKESTKDEDTLVIYKPMEAITAVYKLIDKDSSVKSDNEEDQEDTERKLSMREVACCKICAPCYQVSWRGIKKGKDNRTMSCPICGRTSVSVYNLLTHVKTHAAGDVRRKRKVLAAALKEVVDYHYKCRICQQHFLSIKELRRHVSTHRGGCKLSHLLFWLEKKSSEPSSTATVCYWNKPTLSCARTQHVSTKIYL